MTVQCPRCKTRYRFDEDSVGNAKIRLRCTRCGEVFSYNTGLNRPAAPPAPDAAPPAHEKDLQKIAELLDDINHPTQVLFSDSEESYAVEESEEAAVLPGEVKETRSKKRSLRKVLTALFLIACAGAFILLSSPGARTSFMTVFDSAFSRIEKLTGWNNDATEILRPEKEVFFTDVRESFHMNWFEDHILVIEGITVNKNAVALARIRVRGKLLDNEKTVIDQRESYCGNILSEEELRNLTIAEIGDRLLDSSTPEDTVKPIPPGGSIPFMLVFANPPKEAGEFIVEPAEAAVVKTR